MPASQELRAKVDSLIKDNKVFVASKSYCPHCQATHKLLRSLKVDYKSVELDHEDDGASIQQYLAEKTGQSTVPNIFISGNHIGGNSDLQALNSNGKLATLL